MAGPSVLWFRHGLRLHDNPALLEAITNRDQSLMPIFIFDNETAGTKLVGYNRLKFLLESLADLDNQLRALGGQLFIFRGQPVNIFRRLWEELGISLICYEQDCEPIWQNRDGSVINLCRDIGIRCVEKVSHTLWNPTEVIQANGGIPPLTYQMFLHTVQIMGHPSRPVPDPDWTSIKFVKFPPLLAVELNFSTEIPNPEDFDIYADYTKSEALLQWKGGEEEALKNLQVRLKVEEEAFKTGFYLPNQAFPDLLGPPTSLSAHLRFGCLSVRKFYWSVHDLFESVQSNSSFHFPGGPHITGQLIWREYFYTMSVQNPNYAQMKDNPICLNIPWSEPKNDLMEKWKLGKTGFPLIDAAMRQLLAEGWLHHTLRNTVATFLTRGALWISWEVGLLHFLKYLLDADWSVCAGNWMWVSSSAFEKLLDSSKCTCPVALARRLDPKGEYIRRYVPELKNLSIAYIHEPWSAPTHIQEEVGCIIGIHYPEPMVDLNFVTNRNANAMKYLRDTLIAQGAPKDGPPHCRPSSNEEIRQFFWLSDEVN